MTTCAYSVETIPALFTDLPTRIYYKDSRAVGMSYEGAVSLLPSYSSTCELTRAQGYRYWEKHFSNRNYYSLPLILQEAIDKPSRSFGQYVSKKDGALIGYEG